MFLFLLSFPRKRSCRNPSSSRFYGIKKNLMSGNPARPARVLKESSAFVDDLLRARRESQARNYPVNRSRVANLLHSLYGRPAIPVALETIQIPITTPDGKGLPRPPTEQERRAVSFSRLFPKKNFLLLIPFLSPPSKFYFGNCLPFSILFGSLLLM